MTPIDLNEEKALVVVGADEEMKDETEEIKEQAQNVASQQSYSFYEPIESAYQWNSARLLEMIFGEC